MFIDNGRKENIGCISSFKEFTFVVEMRQVWSSENLRELLYSYVRKEKSHREERGQSLDGLLEGKFAWQRKARRNEHD